MLLNYDLLWGEFMLWNWNFFYLVIRHLVDMIDSVRWIYPSQQGKAWPLFTIHSTCTWIRIFLRTQLPGLVSQKLTCTVIASILAILAISGIWISSISGIVESNIKMNIQHFWNCGIGIQLLTLPAWMFHQLLTLPAWIFQEQTKSWVGNHSV